MTDWDDAVASAAGTMGEDLRAAFAEVAAARERMYYDAVADEAAATEYYLGVSRDGPSVGALTELVTVTHTSQPRYKPSVEVYPWVDLQPDGTLRSLYTGESYQPEQLIQADAMVLQERMTRILQATMDSTTDPTTSPDRHALTVEALAEALPFNCEHVVPQSWFAKHEPMRGDLHHLFACESRCNSFRGNTPYTEFADFPTASVSESDQNRNVVRDVCGKSAAGGFEPVHGKGAAARAVCYFRVRYPDVIAEVEMPLERWAMVLGWHEQQPVSTWERHRNAAIFARQGNRNPFIDHPEWLPTAANMPI